MNLSKVSYKTLLVIFMILIQISQQAKKQKPSVVVDISDVKEFKKLLRTKINVMVLFVNDVKQSQNVVGVFKNTADAMKGQATLVMVDCSNSESKKLCKKVKVAMERPYQIKHYKDGEYHKEYERSETVSSMSNFLRDPTGELPWEEDPTATDVYHLVDGEALSKFLKKSAVTNKRAMVMFYAPWCGFCKILKPEYVQAATDLKGEAMLAAIDAVRPVNAKIRQLYNVTAFPTLYYYEKGQYRFSYNGDNKRDAMVAFMRDPTDTRQDKRVEVDDSWPEGGDVLHLDGDNFDSVLSKAEHALVVFYAPWCGHCKRIKPEFEKAASRIKAEKLNGILAAVDATKHSELGSRFDVKGYPTLKYFSRGEYRFDAGHARQADQIVKFIKDPQESAAPAAEVPWAEEASAVRHLDAASFKQVLRKVTHALVMFYAPWCGHCKTTKPEFVRAAESFADELMVAFAAVDCTAEAGLCASHGVKGYPTIKYFSHYDKRVEEYTGGRKWSELSSYIHSRSGAAESLRAPATPQQAGFGASVRLASDHDFERTVAGTRPTFVMFYATWCGHCVATKPAFSRLATAFADNNMGITAIAVDAAENGKVADIAKVQTLPTFKLYVAGKEVATYEGDRSFEDMMAFCKSHAKLKEEL